VHGAKPIGVERYVVAWRQTRRLQVDGLSTNEARGTGGIADGLQDTDLSRQDDRLGDRWLAREQGKGFGLQAVAGQNRNAVAVLTCRSDDAPSVSVSIAGRLPMSGV
jgi:hypothetical protein